ncbi:MAG: LicD family protein [Clostridiales bacterium]|nr:LicD family protein [Clostridiales bacterium]
MNLSTFDLVKKLSSERSDRLVTVSDDDVRRIQKVLLDMMEDTKSVCEENGITYMLVGGSALGAVRHDGFIPWDDDMDIGMTGRDFKKFVKLFEEKFGGKYWVHTEDTPEYGSVIGKIRLKGSTYKGRDDLFTDECGIPVDIFRLENVSDNKFIRKIHKTFCMGIGLVLSCRLFYRNREYYMDLAAGDKDIEKVFKRKIRLGSLFRFMSVKSWAKLTEKFYGACKKDGSKCVVIPSGRKHFSGEIYSREDMLRTEDHIFDGHTFPIPAGYDAYLKQLYGDYMKIPSPEERESHLLVSLDIPQEYR